MSHTTGWAAFGAAVLASLPLSAAAQTTPELAIAVVEAEPIEDDVLGLSVTVQNVSLLRTGPVEFEVRAFLATDSELIGPNEEIGRWTVGAELERDAVETFDFVVDPVMTHDPACYDVVVAQIVALPLVDTALDDNLGAAEVADCGAEGPPLGGPIAVEAPAGFGISRTWRASRLGIPDKLGGLAFVSGGFKLVVVTQSETYDSQVWSLDVTRSATQKIVGLVNPRLLFDTGSEDWERGPMGFGAGIALDPDGELLVYTAWGENELRERPTELGAEFVPAERVVLPLPPTVTGLTRSPQRDEWLIGARFRSAMYLLPRSRFLRYSALRLVEVDTPVVGGLAYVPTGDWRGDLLFADWAGGAIRRVRIDESTGFPLEVESREPVLGTDNPVVEDFVGGLGRGPWGMVFDPISNDLLVATWTHEPDDQLLLFDSAPLRRAGPLAENLELSTLAGKPVDFTLPAADVDSPSLQYELLDELQFGRLEGEPPNLRYVPEVDVLFAVDEVIRYVASDGFYESDPAAVTIRILPTVSCGGCAGGGLAPQVWGVLLLALILRRKG